MMFMFPENNAHENIGRKWKEIEHGYFGKMVRFSRETSAISLHFKYLPVIFRPVKYS